MFWFTLRGRLLLPMYSGYYWPKASKAGTIALLERSGRILSIFQRLSVHYTSGIILGLYLRLSDL